MAKKHLGESNGNILRLPSQVMIIFLLLREKEREMSKLTHLHQIAKEEEGKKI